MRPGVAALGGVALLGLGMALAFAAVAGAPVFRVGTIVLALGFLAVVAAGVLRVLQGEGGA